MTNEAQSLDFPFLAGVPKREKSRIGKLLDVVEDIKKAQRQLGPIVCQRTVADILGLSTARVGQLLDSGKLEGVQVGRSRFVSIASFEHFCTLDRKPGRPVGFRVSKAKQQYENFRAIGQAAGIEI